MLIKITKIFKIKENILVCPWLSSAVSHILTGTPGARTIDLKILPLLLEFEGDNGYSGQCQLQQPRMRAEF